MAHAHSAAYFSPSCRRFASAHRRSDMPFGDGLELHSTGDRDGHFQTCSRSTHQRRVRSRALLRCRRGRWRRADRRRLPLCARRAARGLQAGARGRPAAHRIARRAHQGGPGPRAELRRRIRAGAGAVRALHHRGSRHAPVPGRSARARRPRRALALVSAAFALLHHLRLAAVPRAAHLQGFELLPVPLLALRAPGARRTGLEPADAGRARRLQRTGERAGRGLQALPRRPARQRRIPARRARKHLRRRHRLLRGQRRFGADPGAPAQHRHRCRVDGQGADREVPRRAAVLVLPLLVPVRDPLRLLPGARAQPARRVPLPAFLPALSAPVHPAPALRADRPDWLRARPHRHPARPHPRTGARRRRWRQLRALPD